MSFPLQRCPSMSWPLDSKVITETASSPNPWRISLPPSEVHVSYQVPLRASRSYSSCMMVGIVDVMDFLFCRMLGHFSLFKLEYNRAEKSTVLGENWMSLLNAEEQSASCSCPLALLGYKLMHVPSQWAYSTQLMHLSAIPALPRMLCPPQQLGSGLLLWSSQWSMGILQNLSNFCRGKTSEQTGDVIRTTTPASWVSLTVALTLCHCPGIQYCSGFVIFAGEGAA